MKYSAFTMSAARLYSTLFLLSICFAFTFASNSSATPTCQILSSLLHGRVYFPGEEAYHASVTSYFYMQQQDQTPTCVIKPVSAEEVSRVVITLGNSSMTTFAIRSGGHSTNRGFSNVDGGITIDLTAINTVSILPDDVTVSVGAGAVWADVYSVLDSQNRSLNGARASGVGVGGFLSGGNVFKGALHL
jgi:FAD/FMN-containing dehydrogenase